MPKMLGSIQRLVKNIQLMVKTQKKLIQKMSQKILRQNLMSKMMDTQKKKMEIGLKIPQVRGLTEKLEKKLPEVKKLKRLKFKKMV
jgi:hypothetical protein